MDEKHVGSHVMVDGEESASQRTCLGIVNVEETFAIQETSYFASDHRARHVNRVTLATPAKWARPTSSAQIAIVVMIAQAARLRRIFFATTTIRARVMRVSHRVMPAIVTTAESVPLLERVACWLLHWDVMMIEFV